ncbi:MAG: glycosyltransferase family 4 protein [Chloroflexi bacterium]|nr:glycosyltransferase family 4 protein [Chloroflexota bacterium]
MTRVLHLLGSAAPEGAGIARQVKLMASELADEYTFEAWFLGGEGPLAAELAEAGVCTRIIPWRGLRDVTGTSRLTRAFGRGRWDVVHQHFGGPTLRLLAKAAARAPLVNHVHGLSAESGWLPPSAAAGLAADYCVATSDYVATGLRARRVDVVHPAIEAPIQAPPRCPKGQLVIGSAGRLVPLKGFDVLIDAHTRLREHGIDPILEIAGDGPEYPRLGAAVRLGWQDDLGGVMGQWDVYAQPSRSEAFGIACLEAMAHGLPVVASRVGGLPELVVDGETGWLVDPGDAHDLAEKLAWLSRDLTMQRRFGQAGRARAIEHFSPKRLGDDISAVYKALT